MGFPILVRWHLYHVYIELGPWRQTTTAINLWSAAVQGCWCLGSLSSQAISNQQTLIQVFWEWRQVICLVNKHRESGLQDHSVYVSSQWETALQCNTISHWLGAYTEWSLGVWQARLLNVMYFAADGLPWCDTNIIKLSILLLNQTIVFINFVIMEKTGTSNVTDTTTALKT